MSLFISDFHHRVIGILLQGIPIKISKEILLYHFTQAEILFRQYFGLCKSVRSFQDNNHSHTFLFVTQDPSSHNTHLHYTTSPHPQPETM